MPDKATPVASATFANTDRLIARLFPIGVKDGPPVYVVVCTDGSIWELDRRCVYPVWEQMPVIPGVVGAL